MLNNITIFYGENGSDKSTLLNIVAEKLKANRKNKIDKGIYFKKYVDCCSYELSRKTKPNIIKIIISDDVFDYLFDIRSINNHLNKNRDVLFKEYLNNKYKK